MTETWLISGETDGIALWGDEREFGAVFEDDLDVPFGEDASLCATTVLPDPTTTTSSLDIARLLNNSNIIDNRYNKQNSEQEDSL